MTIRPRDYQENSRVAIWQAIRKSPMNPCVVLPTGAGKTIVIALLIMDAVLKWGGRVLVLAHVKELLEQTAEKIAAMCDEVSVGVYSAGLGRRDTEQPVIVAGIQSVYKRAKELGHFDIVIVDECHLIPASGDGMYRQLLLDLYSINPNMRVIGLTATPYRLDSGMLCGPDELLNEICYEVRIRELIVQGFLCPIVSRGSRRPVDTERLRVRAGEFVADDIEAQMDSEERVSAAVDEIIQYAEPDRNAVLVFGATVSHAHHLADELRDKTGKVVEIVTGSTPTDEREVIIRDFKAGRIKYLVNVNVLTTGFDAPNVDCIAMVRPTLSPGLLCQIAGRGLRLHPSKKDCLFLDFGGNILRHGPIDAIRTRDRNKAKGDAKPPAKECPECHALIATGYSECPECHFVFPLPKRNLHDTQATAAEILSGLDGAPPPRVEEIEYEVEWVEYNIHEKKGAPNAPTTMRVAYFYEDPNVFTGTYSQISEWVCLNHTGFARGKAEEWWRVRSNAPVPDTVEEAVRIAQKVLAPPSSVRLQFTQGEKWPKLVDVLLGQRPDYDPDALVDADTSFPFGELSANPNRTELEQRGLPF